MKLIENFMNPERLKVLWQAIDPQENDHRGKRFVVGELYPENDSLVLQYLDNEDTSEAVSAYKFKGMTAYAFEPGKRYNGTVEQLLAKRVASPERPDYAEYLLSYRLPPDRSKEISLLQLLAYTGGRLTGDGFCFVPCFKGLKAPFDFMISEIAGFRHWEGMKVKPLTDLLNRDVRLVEEPDNEKDPDAIAIYLQNSKIGFVPRGMATELKGNVMGKHAVTATIAKLNGSSDRPKVSVLVQVS